MFIKRSESLLLEQAIAALMQSQAVFLQNQAALLAQIAESRKRMADLEEDNRTEFRRIMAMLLRHEQILNELPEAIRQKIGFNPAS